MKKIFKTHLGRLGFATLLLFSIIVIHSCRKQATLMPDELKAEANEKNFAISQAKEWFTAHKTALANRIKINSDASFLTALADFTPVWDSARTAVDTNYYVVEAPAKYLHSLGFKTDSAANINGVTRLLILKYKKTGALSAALMHINSNTGINNNVHYMAVPQTFSGKIFYTSLQGGFIYGYIYNAGKVVRVSSGHSTSYKPAGPRILLMDYTDCTSIVTDYYYQNCYFFPDASYNYCDDWKYLFTTTELYCPVVPGGNSGSVPPPDPCPPTGGGGDEPTVESVKGKLIVAFYDDGGGGDDGGDGGDGSPCETCQAKASANAADYAPVSDNTNVSITSGSTSSTDPNKRSKIYTWICATSGIPGGWYETSIETGIHKRVGNDWEWESLTHNTTQLNGLVLIGTMTFDANAVIAVYDNSFNAHMEMNYSTKLEVKCEGLPGATFHWGPYNTKSKNWYSNLP